MQPLPIDALIPQILVALKKTDTLIVKASPGSGKTTRIPVRLLKSGMVNADEKILILEPRRLAAKWAAMRVAQELGEPVGKTVGYQFRAESKVSERTRILFLTEGTFIRMVQANPRLNGIGMVILDEFHERHLQTDIALAFVDYLRGAGSRAKLLILSATLDSARLKDFLPNAVDLELELSLFPVSVEYWPAEGPLEQLVERSARSLAEHEGDILVFLPGIADIRRCEESLARLANERRWAVCPLHGDLDRDAQDRAMGPLDRKKIILATNIAESSLTIDGVATVVDSGLHRQAGYSHWSGIGSLKTRAISQASAIQRMGRAGRQGPGHCIRLYSEENYRQRPAFDIPEILRADLSETVFSFVALQVPLNKIRFLDPPQAAVISSSLVLLRELGAINAHEHLTELGHRMSALPLHPRLSRILIEAKGSENEELAVRIVASISEGDLPDGDVLKLSENRDGHRTRSVVDRLQRILVGSRAKGPVAESSLPQMILSGFADRVARVKRVESSKAELVFAEGGVATLLRPQFLIQNDWIVVLDAQETERFGKKETMVRSFLPITVEDLMGLDTPLLRSIDDLKWDRERERAVSRSALYFGKLAIEEELKPAQPSVATGRILLREVLKLTPELASKISLPEFIRLFGGLCDLEKLECLMARARIADSQTGAPSWDYWTLSEALFAQFSSLAELKVADWLDLWWRQLSGDQGHAWLKRVPELIELPSGRRVPIQYRLDREPWVESRLQDFLGMAVGPSILGRPILLHLLAPNHRAVQVTNDLMGFWQRTYPEVRRELSRRYPRHSWPENPLEKPKKK